MTKQRPVNLDLTTMHFPPMAIVSILHRLSGIAIFLLFPLLLCVLDRSLESADGFARVSEGFHRLSGKLFLWFTISVVLFHVIAGIRHLLMDFGVGETLKGGRCTAWTVMIGTAIFSVLIGIWLW